METIAQLPIDLPDIDAALPPPRDYLLFGLAYRRSLMQQTATSIPLPIYPEFVLIWLTRGCCWYCGQAFGDGQLFYDHVIPWSRGGPNRVDNYVPACNVCNGTKSAWSLSEYRELMCRKYKLQPGHTILFWGEIVGLSLPLIKHFKPEEWGLCPSPRTD